MTRYLDAHPQVHMAPGKELRFFTTNYDKGVGWYSDQFAGAEARLCGEATPAYLANPTAMNRLRELLPDVRLIAILRDPVDRALSHYWMARERGRESREFPHAAYDEMGQLRMDVARSAILPYLGPGLYAHHLGRVLDLFPRTRVLPLIFERMVDDPISVTESCARSWRSIQSTCRTTSAESSTHMSPSGPWPYERRHGSYPASPAGRCNGSIPALQPATRQCRSKLGASSTSSFLSPIEAWSAYWDSG